MCLSIITNVIEDVDIKKVVKGWKIFDKKADGLHFPVRHYEKVCKGGVWIESIEEDIKSCFGDHPNYKSGFHCFKKESDAETFKEESMQYWDECRYAFLVVEEVECRGVMYEGSQNETDVFVCKFIKIEKEKTND